MKNNKTKIKINKKKCKKENVLKSGWIPGSETFILKAITYAIGTIFFLGAAYYCGTQALLNYEIFTYLNNEAFSAILNEIINKENVNALPFKTITEYLTKMEELNIAPEDKFKFINKLIEQLTAQLANPNGNLTKQEIQKLQEIIKLLKLIQQDSLEEAQQIMSNFAKIGNKGTKRGFVE